jgi:hypothetical protein
MVIKPNAYDTRGYELPNRRRCASLVKEKISALSGSRILGIEKFCRRLGWEGLTEDGFDGPSIEGFARIEDRYDRQADPTFRFPEGGNNLARMFDISTDGTPYPSPNCLQRFEQGREKGYICRQEWNILPRTYRHEPLDLGLFFPAMDLEGT